MHNVSGIDEGRDLEHRIFNLGSKLIIVVKPTDGVKKHTLLTTLIQLKMQKDLLTENGKFQIELVHVV